MKIFWPTGRVEDKKRNVEQCTVETLAGREAMAGSGMSTHCVKGQNAEVKWKVVLKSRFSLGSRNAYWKLSG